ncbi:MAG: NAD-dependent epimerase/dehydratase family protein [Chitinophagaceae bacterium]|nr:NAD-dependent epimerase/dehydratase family protein [Chitinophagaceae bacterium]
MDKNSTIFITGGSGFVGSNLIRLLKEEYKLLQYEKNKPLAVNEDVVIHLAGKAHDIKNVSVSKEYYDVNTELTKQVFDAFLQSDAKVFITLSSVKAVADSMEGDLVEDCPPNPQTHYGKSKLLAEQYILSKQLPANKHVYILRPSMIHGPGNKGNLNLLYSLVSKGLVWPLGAFNNKRSFCSIENLLFILKELIERQGIPSGVYNVADDEPLSTNEIILLIAASKSRKPKIWKIPPILINTIAKVGDTFNLSLNSERLHKLTSSYVVRNNKIKNAIGKPLPVNSKEGLLKTFKSFEA